MVDAEKEREKGRRDGAGPFVDQSRAPPADGSASTSITS
jgi:hypothetical protein